MQGADQSLHSTPALYVLVLQKTGAPFFRGSRLKSRKQLCRYLVYLLPLGTCEAAGPPANGIAGRAVTVSCC